MPELTVRIALCSGELQAHEGGWWRRNFAHLLVSHASLYMARLHPAPSQGAVLNRGQHSLTLPSIMP